MTLLGGKKAADEMGERTIAAIDDARQPAIGRFLDELTVVDRLTAHAARHHMRIVARHEHQLALINLHALALTDTDINLAGNDIVQADEVMRVAEEVLTVLRRDVRNHTPGRREARIEEDAALQPKPAQNLGERVFHRKHLFLPPADQSILPAAQSFTMAVDFTR